MDISQMNLARVTEITSSILEGVTDKDIKHNNYRELETLLLLLEADPRKGLQRLAGSCRTAILKRYKEILRIESMINFDKSYKAGLVAGVDEVGRGPLAGPVVAGCVIMDLEKPISGIDDSKKLSRQKRELLFDQIVKNSLYCAIGQADNDVIDRINILNATFSAMNSAISLVSSELQDKNSAIGLILVDGNQKIKNQSLPQCAITKGDSKSYSIACASILAKVYRDRLMEKMGEKFPGYDFESNSGYGSASHLAGIAKLGLSPIHRKSFCHM